MEEIKVNEDISRKIEDVSKSEPIVAHDIAEKEEQIAKSVAGIPVIKDEMEERKKKVINFLKQPHVWVLGFLIIALVLGIHIRSLPMQDHGGHPGLWDITTNTWTLGPDLDPWLFLRTAETIVNQDSMPETDVMRNMPFGFDNSKETMLLPYMIVLTYKISKLFYAGTNIEFAGAVFPVIMFALTIISFFLFVREIFAKKSKRSKTKANIISLISTFFMIITPIFLSRTVAGIPEKESAAFFFMFLSFYLFLKAWKSERLKQGIIFGILSGISTTIMGLIWGGVIFIYISIALASFIAFILNKVHKKEFLIYASWILPTIIMSPLLSGRTSFMDMLTSLSSGLAFGVFLIFLTHFILWNTKLSQYKIFSRTKLPKNIISIIAALILITILVLIIFGPSFIVSKFKAIHQQIFKPVVGRWNTTVAENRQPYFTEWGASFGPFVKGIPLMFWAFITGSIVLFRRMLKYIHKKDAWILTGLYVLLLMGMIFSRYSGSGIFNGENFISKIVYYGAVLLFLGVLIKIYLKYYKEGNKSFEKIRYEYLFLLILLLLAVFSARGAVRLIMMLGSIAPIFLAYLIYSSIDKFQKVQDETGKMILGIVIILILISSVFIFWSYYNSIKSQSYSMVPSIYNQQWQKAMSWVRENTPEPIITETTYIGPVFGHWWDYGYWVQSIGKRGTVLDGGNAITFWNYWMGRLVLTGDNQEDALEFLYNHNTTHFLIDSSDIGKYGAFSSIGSDKNYDRYSWIQTLDLDESATQETKNKTIYVYRGGIPLDEDLIINKDGKQIFFPAGQAGVGAVLLTFEQEKLLQPSVIIAYQGNQQTIPLRYVSVGGEFLDFGSGIEATAFVFPRIINSGQGIQANPLGSMMFLSPRVMKGMLAQKYILDDPFNNFPNFKLVHTEQNLIIEDLNSQGMTLPDFIYYNGIQGPIKIWEIEYTGDEEIKEEYLDRDASKYLDWEL